VTPLHEGCGKEPVGVNELNYDEISEATHVSSRDSHLVPATAASCLSAAGVQCRLPSRHCPNLEFRARCYPERKFINMHPYNRFKQHNGAASPHLSVLQHPGLCQGVNKVCYFAIRKPRKLLKK
jgi:hypothetical protein